MATVITDMNLNRKVLHSCHLGSLNNNYCVKFINYIMNYFCSLGRISEVFCSPLGSLDKKSSGATALNGCHATKQQWT
jgi:hypothetical protein